MQQEVNIKVGDRDPAVYFSHVITQCTNGEVLFGGITSHEDLLQNLVENCIPANQALQGNLQDYDTFLQERRILMAAMMQKYYQGL